MDIHGRTQTYEPLHADVVTIFETISDKYADLYIKNFICKSYSRILGEEVDESSVKEALLDPFLCLSIFYGNYGFSRRRKLRDPLSHAALEALRTVTSREKFSDWLVNGNPDELWDVYLTKVGTDKALTNETHNRGVLQGAAELAQDFLDEGGTGSLAGWIAQQLIATRELEESFNRIVDIRGVGPKGAATFLRDVIVIFDLADRLVPKDRIYVQPVDRWIRLIAGTVVPEEGITDAADWIVAGKVNKYARIAGVDGLRFNMGTTYFGQKKVRVPERYEAEIAKLIAESSDEQP